MASPGRYCSVEIDHFQGSGLAIPDDVRGIDVAVNHAACVDAIQLSRDETSEHEHVFQCDGCADMDMVSQGIPCEVLQYNRARAFVRHEVVRCDRAVEVQPTDGLEFPLILDESAREIVYIAHEYLEDYTFAIIQPPCPTDARRGALVNRLQNFEVAFPC